MKAKLFDVIKLKNGQKAIIKQINKENTYTIEVINNKTNELEKRTIKSKEISKILYSRGKEI